MKKTADAIVIGGGVAGAATAFYLTRRGLRVILLERDFLTAGSTGRCIGGIRQQFSTELSIRVAMEAVKKFARMSDELGTDVEFYQGGYLFLAHSREKQQVYETLIKLQRGMGLDVRWVGVREIEQIVPGINTEDLLGGAYCPSDGQANPFLVVHGYARRIGEHGEVLVGKEVVAIERSQDRVTGVRTRDGEEYQAPIVVNAAGPWLNNVAALAGVAVPVFPERHESLITEPLDRFFDPMIVDYRDDGCYFNQKYHNGSIIGCYTPKPNVPGLDLGCSYQFLTEMGRRMARLIPKLASVKIMRQWSGSYEMTPDGNPIVDRTAVQGFWVVGGLCGHGFMLGPEIGYLCAECIATGKPPYDIKDFYLNRTFGGPELMK